MKHKHSEVLHAFVDGIECQGWDHAKKIWYDITNISSFEVCDDARIKPNPDITRYYLTHRSGRLYECYTDSSSSELKLTWDAETGRLKDAKVI